ncbi:tyrosine-type recombinase/integrase [Flavobacterium succinicans]|uniref:Tyrosine recombinase XerD n=1 Tax=Flavobacterium succinicans TaxID=29536 RepID=A0A199XQP0_9FLAO|nr:phage integrase SAM-like domain-containing protein [Flavobacterium succinicans]OAZ03644.1 tyrosine recombinase XerD [Flavobacterium succinicans]
MATVNFLYRSTKEKANLHLRLLYRFNDTDFVFGANTKFEVLKDYWNKQHKKKSKDIDISNRQTEVNTELNKIENHVLNAFNSVNPDEINKEWLQTQIDYYYNPPQQAEKLPTELNKYLLHYIDAKRTEVTESTIKKCNVIKQLLTRYQSHYKKNLLLTDIDTNFKTHFENYCLSNGYAPNTIARTIRFIKTICKHAKSNGLETSYQLDSIKVKYHKIESIYLTVNELEAIEKTSGLVEHLDNARDWLLISCYTGQRVSDFMRFTKEMIRFEKNKEGVLKPLIEFTQKKTGKEMTVPLSQKVMDILSKRNGEFPRAISDQKYNDYIKIVCREAKITQKVNGSVISETAPESGIYRKETGVFEKCDLVTSHIGRRSFATNNYGIIPTSFLIYVTGHSTEAMFLNYIGKSNKDIAMELTNYF